MTYGLRSDGVAMSTYNNSGLGFIIIIIIIYSGTLKYMASLLILFSEYAVAFLLLVLLGLQNPINRATIHTSK